MYSLMAAIKSLFDSQLATFFAGGYVHRIGMPAQGKPMLVVAMVGGMETDRNTGPRRLENPRVRFTAVASDDATAAAGADLVEKTLRSAVRNISTVYGDEYIARIVLKGEELAQDPDQDTDQTEVWYGIKEFEFTIGRTPL